ncbi:MAG: GNAT family N-acetyltransferase [Oscillospiraceae bacterium]|nr:GNAT family N-acetyltransferase [Oscillospiraceae bacterium]
MIRPAVKSDVDAVYRLMRQLSRHDFTKEQFEDCYLYNLEKGRVLVYEEGNIVCGCAVFAIHYHLHFSCKTAEIINLIVDEHARNRGIGKELLTALEQIAKDNGCVRVEVDSGKHREAAHRFYEREGFASTHYKLTKGPV